MEAKVMTKKQQNNQQGDRIPHRNQNYDFRFASYFWVILWIIIEELSLSWRFRHCPAQKTF